jgi:hypothetical protein
MPFLSFDAVPRDRVTSAYLIAEEKIQDKRSQNTLPAPPTDIPTATPRIFPTPRVPDSARINEITSERLTFPFMDLRVL